MASFSYTMSYADNSTELCEIATRYGTDKSPDTGCKHGYTLFYRYMFESRIDDSLNIAEIGVSNGASIRTWHEYFSASMIYGFDNDAVCIDSFEKTERIHLSHMDVCDGQSIVSGFEQTGVLYDLIIDDSTNVFEDQIRIIQNAYKFLKPGGFIVIEDIRSDVIEMTYENALWQILNEFSAMYFVKVVHNRQDKNGIKNHKLLFLVKAGAPNIFFQLVHVNR